MQGNRCRYFVLVIVVWYAITSPTPAHAGFNPFSKKAAGSGAGGSELLDQGVQLLTFLTIATDLGVAAASDIADMYPPDKVAGVRDLSLKYNELKGKRTNGNIDAESLKLATQVGQETALLEQNWQSYQKEKTSNVPKADRRLALMLAADGVAASKVPGLLDSLKNETSAMAGNPLALKSAGDIAVLVGVFTVVAQQLPSQTSSFSTVRTIARSIAKAENMHLADDVDPDTVKDTTSLQSVTKELTE